jgi:hypothetical protein
VSVMGESVTGAAVRIGAGVEQEFDRFQDSHETCRSKEDFRKSNDVQMSGQGGSRE